MSNKKKKKKPNPVAQRLNEVDAATGAANRVTKVIQRMTEPPETVFDHLKRLGVEPIIDKMSLDNTDPKVYVLIDYQELTEKELEYYRAGGDFREEYPAKGSVEAVEPTNTVMLDEIRQRMTRRAEDIIRHPSSSSTQANKLLSEGAGSGSFWTPNSEL